MKKMSDQRAGGFLITKIHQLSGRIFSRKMKKHQINDLNPAQGRIMFALWQNDGISIKDLVKETVLGKSTLTTMLDRLVNSGHVKRVVSKTDKRQFQIYLTDKSKKIEIKYSDISEEMNNLFYKGFSDLEIDQFEKNLTRILKNLQNHTN